MIFNLSRDATGAIDLVDCEIDPATAHHAVSLFPGTGCSDRHKRLRPAASCGEARRRPNTNAELFQFVLRGAGECLHQSIGRGSGPGVTRLARNGIQSASSPDGDSRIQRGMGRMQRVGNWWNRSCWTGSVTELVVSRSHSTSCEQECGRGRCAVGRGSRAVAGEHKRCRARSTGCADGHDVIASRCRNRGESPPEIDVPERQRRRHPQSHRGGRARSRRAGSSTCLRSAPIKASPEYHKSKREAEESSEFHGRLDHSSPRQRLRSRRRSRVAAAARWFAPSSDSCDRRRRRPFQPLWVDDLAHCDRRCRRAPDLHGKILELAGTETTTTNELIDSSLRSSRDGSRLEFRSGFSCECRETAVANAVGAPFPVNDSQMTMLQRRQRDHDARQERSHGGFQDRADNTG